MFIKTKYFNFFISYSFTLVVSGKIYFAQLNQQSRAGTVRSHMFLGPLTRSRLKKYKKPEPLRKKVRSRSRLEKKQGAGAGAAKKLSGSPPLVTLKIFYQIHVSDLSGFEEVTSMFSDPMKKLKEIFKACNFQETNKLGIIYHLQFNILVCFQRILPKYIQFILCKYYLPLLLLTEHKN